MIRITPRAPLLSTGFITRGNPRSEIIECNSDTDLTKLNHGIGIPAAKRVSFIKNLSEHFLAVSVVIPGKLNFSAILATVNGTSVAIQMTPSMGLTF